MNERINLLEPNKNTGATVFLRRLHFMRIITIGLLFVVSVSSVILFILVALSPLPALQRQENSLKQTLAQSKSDIVKLAIVNDQSQAISTLLKSRKTLDVQLGQVLAKLPKDMTVTGIKTDPSSMQLTVESSSLQSFDMFLNALIGFVQNKQYFSKVILVEMTTDLTNNAYAATVQLNLL